MAIKKKSKTKAAAAPTRETIAADPPDMASIADADVALAVAPDVDPDDGEPVAGGAVLLAEDARLTAATQQLGEVFDSIEKRGIEALDRRQAAFQATIALTANKDFKAIVSQHDAPKLTRLTEAGADSAARLAAVAEERRVLVETMAGARLTMGVKKPRRRAVGK